MILIIVPPLILLALFGYVKLRTNTSAVLGGILVLMIFSSIVMGTIRLVSSTVFANKISVEVTYNDRSTQVRIVNKEDYNNWLLAHKGLTTTSGVIP
jgi:hypothetical protein